MRNQRALAAALLIAVATVAAAVGVATRSSVEVLVGAIIAIGGLLVLDRFPADHGW